MWKPSYMSQTFKEETRSGEKTPSAGTEAVGSKQENPVPATISLLTEAFTTCGDVHREVLTYGCTVCNLLVCDECFLKQRSTSYHCFRKGQYYSRRPRPLLSGHTPFPAQWGSLYMMANLGSSRLPQTKSFSSLILPRVKQQQGESVHSRIETFMSLVIFFLVQCIKIDQRSLFLQNEQS